MAEKWLKKEMEAWRRKEHLSITMARKVLFFDRWAELQANWKSATSKDILKLKISSTIFSMVLRGNEDFFI
jgi:hypothetical protein